MNNWHRFDCTMAINRRKLLLAGSVLASTWTGTTSFARSALDVGGQAVSGRYDHDGIWLGPDFWANRYQDWKRRDGWIECLRGEAGFEARTVAILTRQFDGLREAAFTVRLEPLTDFGTDGFGGFLVGVGSGRLDYRAAALAQCASGKGGGIFAVVEADGQVAFREHESQSRPLAFDRLEASRGGRPSHAPWILELVIKPAGGGRCDLLLSARGGKGELVSSATLRGIEAARVAGGASLVSSTPMGKPGARFRFRDLIVRGAGAVKRADRSLGPVIGTLYSLANGKLKLAAHCCPVDPALGEMILELQQNGIWRETARVRPSLASVALFEIDRWNGAHAVRYRLHHSALPTLHYEGLIRKEPTAPTELKIALHGCILSVQHALEANPPMVPMVPQERAFGRYEPDNFAFPHNEMVDGTLAHDPDIIIFSGDQYYEHNPTRAMSVDTPYEELNLDTLYRFHQFIWSFERMTRDRPTILLVDDHDVLQGNLWGEGGHRAEDKIENRGGYVHGADFIRMVEYMQCAHNPDAYDPTPIEQNIPVNYTAWAYGGVSFAIVEDRKFKVGPIKGNKWLDAHTTTLLGERQEKFLETWQGLHPGLPKVLLTQSLWGSLQTSPDRQPFIDFDSHGYPPLGRRRAVALAKRAGAVILSGDQHMASLVRHGIDRFDDGPIQFTCPAGASFWERWFETDAPLPNARPGVPDTGDFRDAFGNPMRVLAVANPKITFAKYRAGRPAPAQTIRDRALKSEGYGLVRVNARTQRFVFECWPWDADPRRDAQFHGWPYEVGFADV